MDENKLIGMAYAEHMTDHYRRASEELLYAYQRNKEAARHHEAGAFRAALHHAKLSKHHSFNAHAHLTDALGFEQYLSRLGFLQKVQAAQAGGLSRPAGANERERLAFLQVERNALEHLV